MPEPLHLEKALRAARDAGRKLLVPYVTGGLPGWGRVVEAVAAAGADAIEVGIPFSDPVMDGPTIQEASERALAAGATPMAIVDELGRLDVGGVPLVVMTYYNTVHRVGDERFAASLAAAGVSGAIVPDVPLEEVGPWAAAADAVGVATVLLAAPTGSEERLRRICERSRGWVYGVG
ncbi:MAG TPA: tryptophan synthase subunit alpha, partial [Acidimicrobiales bacterium]